ncbi:MAG: DinB family protein [Dehalococcoidia bacterium]|nr:DinB family protein [Dehalococcoidia bacterium]MDZ4279125.1 DinB family protein [Dehalococcoidia bacterium]
MSAPQFVALEITPAWARVNDELIELVDLVPDDKIDWSPEPKLWNFKGILLHVCFGRHGMMGGVIQDARETPDVLRDGQTRDGLKQQLRLSWQRMEPFLADRALLDRDYEATILSQSGKLSGHELAFGQLEHDIHHRADILHYLRDLGIEHPEPDTLERLLKGRLR